MAARKILPVEIWGTLRKSTALAARVPLPAPGGPKKISFMVVSFKICPFIVARCSGKCTEENIGVNAEWKTERSEEWHQG
jgi:hypothetical protein